MWKGSQGANHPSARVGPQTAGEKRKLFPPPFAPQWPYIRPPFAVLLYFGGRKAKMPVRPCSASGTGIPGEGPVEHGPGDAELGGGTLVDEVILGGS